MKGLKNNIKEKFWWSLTPCKVVFYFYYNIEEQDESDIANKLLGDNWLG